MKAAWDGGINTFDTAESESMPVQASRVQAFAPKLTPTSLSYSLLQRQVRGGDGPCH